jgi:hypothetical protein
MAEVIRSDSLIQPLPLVSAVCFAAVVWGLTFGESPMVTIVAGVAPVLAVALLWRPGEPPTLLLVAMVHLLQAEAILVYANVQGESANIFSYYGIDMERATLVAIEAVIALVLGMSIGNLRRPKASYAEAIIEARSWSPRSAFRFFLATLMIASAFETLSALSESVRQIFLAGAGIQWVGIYFLAYVCLQNGQGYSYLVAAVAIEIVSGFTGFFGEFRNVFFALFVASAAARPGLNFRALAIMSVLAATVLVLFSFWSAIKKDYREFLNGGSKEQVVVVPLEARIDFLLDDVNRTDSGTLATGFDLLVLRVGYVEFLGAVLNFVPEGRPHENGALLGAAFEHILFPRLLFPDKPALPNDTVLTEAYTGLPVTESPGTSISIGYAGELYIDFGLMGMLFAMCVLGFTYAKGVRIIQSQSESVLAGQGATVAFLMPALYFETALPKVIGGTLMAFIIVVTLCRFVFPFALNAFTRRGQGPIYGRGQ